MKKGKKITKRNDKAVYTFRILGGGYLVYLAYSMLSGWNDVPQKSKLFIGAFMVIFAVMGAVLVVSSLIKYTRIKNEPVEENYVTDVESEVVEEDNDVSDVESDVAEEDNDLIDVESDVTDVENNVTEDDQQK